MFLERVEVQNGNEHLSMLIFFLTAPAAASTQVVQHLKKLLKILLES